MILSRIFTLIFLLAMISCTSQKEPVDIIVHNARVYTVDDQFSVQEAFAVKDGKFIAAGSNEDILQAFSSDLSIDADGKTIFPGFYDAHCHFYGYGTNKIKRADLVGATSYEEVVDLVIAHDKAYESEWIEGRGWDQNDWEDKNFPTKDLLDHAFPAKPVYLIRIDGHAALVNSAALELAGIKASTKVEGGDVILMNGEPTGVLIDNAMGLVSRIIPDPDKSFNRKALLKAQEDCFAVGLTSVADAGLRKDVVLLIDDMQKANELKMRIYAMLTPNDENIEHFVVNGPYITDQLVVRSLKLFADGALGSRGAKMIDDYSDDPHNSGLYMHSASYYLELCNLAYDNNYQVNTHAIGDGGNRFVLETYAGFLNGKNDLRWRIEHAQIVHPDDFSKFGEYSIIPSVQPTHATSDMYWADERVGHHRIKGAYAFRQLMEENGWIPLGTDFPIENISPLYTFYAAVARKDLKGWPEEGFQVENALTRRDALKGITLWAAMSSFEELVKGSIEPGKFADFVILDQDIMQVEMPEVPEVTVLSTFVAGEEVYSAR